MIAKVFANESGELRGCDFESRSDRDELRCDLDFDQNFVIHALKGKNQSGIVVMFAGQSSRKASDDFSLNLKKINET